MPYWLHILSLVSIGFALACAGIVAIDEMRHPQHMMVMNFVWPLNALFGTAAVLFFYFKYGRSKSQDKTSGARGPNAKTPFAVSVMIGTSHCGAGCTLGDILAEGLSLAAPAILTWLGWRTLFSEKIFATWVLDFLFAFSIGLVFQYLAIVPMRKLSPRAGIIASLKADTASLVAWQFGMYGFMAWAQFYLFRHIAGQHAEPSMPEFWLAMQFAMIAGFLTSFPVNWWLLKAGIKEKM